MVRSLLRPPLLIALLAVAYLEGSPALRARSDLDQYYRSPAHPSRYTESVAMLSSPSSFARQEAASYLTALYGYALEDERSGRIPWHETPYWGGPMESDAREFRSSLADEIGEQAQGDEAVAVVAWALRHEPVASLRAALGGALPRLTGPRSEALIIELLGPTEDNRAVLSQALQEVRVRHLVHARTNVLRLCWDPRPSLRRSAREVAAHLSWAVPKRVEEVAFPAWLERSLRNTATRVLDPPPANARWAIFRTHHPGVPDSVGLSTSGGWWLGEQDTTVRCLDWFGRVTELPRARTEVRFGSFAEAESLLAWARTDAGSKFALEERKRAILSRQGDLTAQFEPSEVSLPEALVAAWAYERGDRATAEAIFGPRLDALGDGSDLDRMGRDLAGTIYYHAMLERLSFDRDYKEAIRIGRHLSRPEFNGYEYQPHARELAAQLGTRGSDFQSFRLPDSASWARERVPLSRNEQIAYLTERLRLLNCFQWGQPGGLGLCEPQYAEATHKKDVWSRPRHLSATLINPWVELDSMRLGVDDLPALAPFLLDRNFTLSFEFWRDFHPDWTLYRVNMLVAHRIEAIAGRDLAHLDDFGKLSSQEQRARVDAVIRWAHVHHGWGARELNRESLRTSRDWKDLQGAIYLAKQEKDSVAGAIVVSRMDDFPDGRQFLLDEACELDTASAVSKARGLLHDEDHEVRLRAARIVLRQGGEDADRAVDALESLKRENDGRSWAAEALPELIASGRPRAIAFATAAFESDDYRRGGEGAIAWAQRLFLMGRWEALNYLIMLLHSSETVMWVRNGPGPEETAVSVRNKTANDLAAWQRDGKPIAYTAPEEAFAHRRAELEAWLKGQFALIESGKQSDIVPSGNP